MSVRVTPRGQLLGPSSGFLGAPWGPPGWSRGAKMTSKDASEVPKLLPKMFLTCQIGTQNDPKWRSREAKGGKKEGAGGRGRSP